MESLDIKSVVKQEHVKDSQTPAIEKSAKFEDF